MGWQHSDHLVGHWWRIDVLNFTTMRNHLFRQNDSDRSLGIYNMSILTITNLPMWLKTKRTSIYIVQ